MTIYALVVNMRNGRNGPTSRLMTFLVKPSGTFVGWDPQGDMDEGPFEAWLEAESVVNKTSWRVSETIDLNPGPAARINRTDPNYTPAQLRNPRKRPPR